MTLKDIISGESEFIEFKQEVPKKSIHENCSCICKRQRRKNCVWGGGWYM